MVQAQSRNKMKRKLSSRWLILECDVWEKSVIFKPSSPHLLVNTDNNNDIHVYLCMLCVTWTKFKKYDTYFYMLIWIENLIIPRHK